ncbi:hypothetical protein [Fortiea contorta]|uniref:hypothetical protein n=1 Tax=Fortiea contorta TaxID=1892405 RepID=UPI00034B1321|nr:hypothetical protein [Fortiea contorta]
MKITADSVEFNKNSFVSRGINPASSTAIFIASRIIIEYLFPQIGAIYPLSIATKGINPENLIPIFIASRIIIEYRFPQRGAIYPLSIAIAGINPVNAVPKLSFTTAPINPYQVSKLGSFSYTSKEFPGFKVLSDIIGFKAFQGFIFYSFEVPVIFQAFSFLSLAIGVSQFLGFLFVPTALLTQFNFLFGVNAIQDINKIVVNKNDLTILPTATAESIFVALFKKWLENNISSIEIEDKKLTVENNKINYTYWLHIFDIPTNLYDVESPINLDSIL